MTTILHLRCSPRGAAAFSSRMAEEVVGRLLDHNDSAEIVFRDLSAHPPPLVDTAFSAAILGPPGETPPALEVSEALIRELEAADAVVIATPNSSAPPPKAWAPVDDAYLQNIVDLIYDQVGKENIKAFWLVGHSQGGMTSNRLVRTPYFSQKVDGWLSLSGGRLGENPGRGNFGNLGAAPGAAGRADCLAVAHSARRALPDHTAKYNYPYFKYLRGG